MSRDVELGGRFGFFRETVLHPDVAVGLVRVWMEEGTQPVPSCLQSAHLVDAANVGLSQKLSQMTKTRWRLKTSKVVPRIDRL